VAALAAGMLLATAPRALAHANLRSSDPPAGAALSQPPPSISLTFTEVPEPVLAVVHVLDSSGRDVDAGSPKPAPGDPHTLEVSVGRLPNGVYTVTWRVVSKTDGHATAGSFAFGVGEAPSARSVSGLPQPTNPPPSPAEVAGRWAMLLGLVAVLGVAMATLIVFGERRVAVARLAVAGAVSAMVGVVVLAFAQRSSAGVGFGTLFGTQVGRALLWRAGAIAVALVGSVLLLRASQGRYPVGSGLAMAGALAAMLAEVAAGHAAGSETYRWAKVGAQWLHFASVGVWIGGLAALLIGIRGAASEDKARAVRRFSALALYALLVLAATGIVRAVNEVGSWGDLFTSAYGLVVVAKGVLFTVLLSIGALNRYRSVPAAARDLSGLRRVSRGELSVAAVALVATALLTSLSPPAPQRAVAPGAVNAVVVSGSDFSGAVRVRLEVEPGVAGPNRFRATVHDVDTGQPVAARRVALRFAFRGAQSIGGSTLELRPAGAAEVFAAAGTNLSLAGLWAATVLVQGRTDSFEIPLDLATACRFRLLSPGPPPIYVSDLPGGASVQEYVDPGTAGFNEVHFTYFDQKGAELPIADLPAVTAWDPSGRPVQLDVRRFSPGHFVAGGQLGPGRWRFDATASAGVGSLSACFQETISG